ncbi:MAG: hypothetical protein M0Q41_12105 [Bacteroidales bacterium]|nr:hypothetical protein [Acholeplasmataceae bacterium]MCK9449705.1 hypothetical protein [Bacteroidales bacterium]
MKIKFETIVITVLLIVNILVLSDLLIYAAPGNGNLVTCYNTFEISGTESENNWEVYDCGSCEKKRCKSFSDSGSCRHNPTETGTGKSN